MIPYSSRRPTRLTTPAFSTMEVLVVLAIVLVIGAIAVPIYSLIQQRAHKQVALDRMRTLGGAVTTYAGQNDGLLPMEDTEGGDTWDNIAKPEAKDAWYNALPKILGRKAAGDYATAPADFYTKDNLLFLPGANYPDKKKMVNPLFAIAFNTKLQRNDPSGEKQRTKMDQITNPSRTVVLLEQGVVNESRTLEVQSKKDYDGSPKGSAKSFVGRYGGQGVLGFLDGHVELAAVKDVLTLTGDFPFPQGSVVWTRTPEENPNKVGVVATAKKKDKDKDKAKE